MFLSCNKTYYVLGSRGVAKQYDLSGIEKSDVTFAYYTEQKRGFAVEVLSLLSNGTTFEFAFFDANDNMTRYYTDSPMTAAEACMKIMGAGNYFRYLRKKGNQDGVSYNQMLFVYRGLCPIDYKTLLNLKKFD